MYQYFGLELRFVASAMEGGELGRSIVVLV